MPGETRLRSVLRTSVHLSQPPRHRHKTACLRGAGILAGHQAVIERAVPVVAGGRRASAGIAGASSTVIAGGGQSGGGSSAGVAPRKRLRIKHKILLAFQIRFWQTDHICRSSGSTVAESLHRKTSPFCATSLPNTPA